MASVEVWPSTRMCDERRIGPPFPAVEDIAIAAHPGVAGPLVARQADETARRVEFRREPVELGPEASVIWKSLPWWPTMSMNAESRA